MSKTQPESFGTITKEQIESWTKSDPREWANESFKITESAETKYLRPARDYINANVPVARVQLQKARIRLAGLLDKALGD
jgi:hypothetical protein